MEELTGALPNSDKGWTILTPPHALQRPLCRADRMLFNTNVLFIVVLFGIHTFVPVLYQIRAMNFLTIA